MENKQNLIINCPHCQEIIEITQINCAIFRHGILKSNFTQIKPHLSQDKCIELINHDLIYGCGKPFKLVKNEPIIPNNESINISETKIKSEYIAIICDYI